MHLELFPSRLVLSANLIILMFPWNNAIDDCSSLVLQGGRYTNGIGFPNCNTAKLLEKLTSSRGSNVWNKVVQRKNIKCIECIVLEIEKLGVI